MGVSKKEREGERERAKERERESRRNAKSKKEIDKSTLRDLSKESES